ncbi:membrane protein [Chania multitudinisentens RB-25]|uniref:Membrane protein n=1 Tax=Chania multitudinisentens RB-25 TaxID=1441930 RepID=W0LJE3_9GAMM|nr:DUF1161 domain-containing protein [Chania multitudinisentens]AHG22447.1 membrane protein [Chania multitudinisentens RB-25]
MKRALVLSVLLLTTAPLMAATTCESIKAEIAQRIVDNGVPESGFRLDIIPNDQANQAAGQVVGHCGFDTQKIVYTRLHGGDNADAAQTGTSQDSKPPQ